MFESCYSLFLMKRYGELRTILLTIAKGKRGQCLKGLRSHLLASFILQMRSNAMVLWEVRERTRLVSKLLDSYIGVYSRKSHCILRPGDAVSWDTHPKWCRNFNSFFSAMLWANGAIVIVIIRAKIITDNNIYWALIKCQILSERNVFCAIPHLNSPQALCSQWRNGGPERGSKSLPDVSSGVGLQTVYSQGLQCS